MGEFYIINVFLTLILIFVFLSNNSQYSSSSSQEFSVMDHSVSFQQYSCGSCLEPTILASPSFFVHETARMFIAAWSWQNKSCLSKKHFISHQFLLRFRVELCFSTKKIKVEGVAMFLKPIPKTQRVKGLVYALWNKEQRKCILGRFLGNDSPGLYIHYFIQLIIILTDFLMYNWHVINCIYLNFTTQVLTYACTYDIITTIK